MIIAQLPTLWCRLTNRLASLPMNTFLNKKEICFSLTDFSAILYCYITCICTILFSLRSFSISIYIARVIYLSLGSLVYAEDGNKGDNKLEKMLPAQHPSADSGKLSAFTMGAEGFSETSIHIYRTLQLPILANSNVGFAVRPVVCLDMYSRMLAAVSIGKSKRNDVCVP